MYRVFPRGFLPRALVLAGLGALLMTLVHDHVSSRIDTNMHGHLQSAADRMSARVERELSLREARVRAVAGLLSLGELDSDQLQVVYRKISDADPYLQALGWVDSELAAGVIHLKDGASAPTVAAVEAAVQAEPTASTLQRLIDEQSGEVLVIGPTQDTEAGLTTICQAWSTPSGTTGVVVLQVEMAGIIETLKSDESPGLRFQVLAADGTLVGGDPQLDGPGESAALVQDGASWLVKAHGNIVIWGQPYYELGLMWVIGTGLVLMLVLAFYLESRRSQSLGHEVQLRTAHLEAARNDLEQARDDRKVALDRYEQLVRQVPAGVWRIDNETRTTFANEQMATMLGRTTDDMMGRPLWDFMDDDARKQAEQNVERRRQGIRENHEFRLMKPSGEFVHTIMTTHPLQDVDGNYLGAEAMVIDISERVRAEQALRVSEARFRSICETSTLGIFQADRAGSVTYRNPALCQMAGQAASDWLLPLAAEDRDQALSMWRSAVEDHQRLNLTARFERDGELRWFALQSAPLQDGDDLLGHVGVVQDITETVTATEELRLHRDHLEELVDLRTGDLEAYAYSVTHDMREPLRTIQAYAAAILEDHGKSLDDDGRFYVNRILAGAQRLDRMAAELINFQKVTRMAIQPRALDLDTVVADVISDHSAEIERLAAVVTVDPLPRVIGTQRLLTQIFANLIGNALKFHAPGQAPRVEVYTEPDEDGYSRICVRDHGIGVPQDAQERVFKLFERLHAQESYDGIGVGLAVVERAVRRLDGRVGLESEPDAGSCFWVALPLAGTDAGASAFDAAVAGKDDGS